VSPNVFNETAYYYTSLAAHITLMNDLIDDGQTSLMAGDGRDDLQTEHNEFKRLSNTTTEGHHLYGMGVAAGQIEQATRRRTLSILSHPRIVQNVADRLVPNSISLMHYGSAHFDHGLIQGRVPGGLEYALKHLPNTQVVVVQSAGERNIHVNWAAAMRR